MITIDVTAEQDGITIEPLCKQWIDPKWGRDGREMSDQPRVRVEVGNTIGGPNFSSTRVFISIEVPYNPANNKAEDVANKVFDRGLELVDSFIPTAYKALIRHLEDIHQDEQNG